MIQMIGGIILSPLGLPDALPNSLEDGGHLDIRCEWYSGYVIMRVTMIAQWATGGGQDTIPQSVASAMTMIVTLRRSPRSAGSWSLLLSL